MVEAGGDRRYKLIWQIWDNNGSQVPYGTRIYNNGMIQPS